MPFRSLVGSFVLLALLLSLNACGTSGASGPTTQATIRGTVVDSATGSRLDSAIALYRGPNDSLYSDASGDFTMPDMPPGLYLFDVSAYGYHEHRHVSALVEPGDEVVDVEVPLLRKTLQINCDGLEAAYHGDVQRFIEDDTTAVRMQLIELFARGDSVRVQPVFVNSINAPLFVPDNVGARGHFDIELFDGEGNSLPFSYSSGASGDLETHRIYSRSDIFTIVPQETQRLEPSLLRLETPVEPGTVIYARMQYDFTLDDTLQATPVSDFPSVGIDSLQVPVYDTLRVDGSVIAADSLVIRRDTTTQRVVGVDTTVTRDGYTLYDTERDTNAFANAQEAVEVLYVPDSVKTRARLDSMFAAGIDTTADAETEYVDDGRPYYVINRTDRARIRTYVTDPLLREVLQFGIPREPFPLEDLRLLPPEARDTLGQIVRPPELPRQRRERKFPLSYFRDLPPLQERMPDSVMVRLIRSDSLAADSLLPGFSDELIRLDSLRLVQERKAMRQRLDSLRSVRDSLAARDTLDATPGVVPDSVDADTAMADSAMADSAMADSAMADTAMTDEADVDAADADTAVTDPDAQPTAQADTTEPEVTMPDVEPDTVRIDSTRKAQIRARADSVLSDSILSSPTWADSVRQRLVDLDVIRTDTVLVDTVLAVDHQSPLPEGLLYMVPDEYTAGDAEVVIVDSAYSQLRAVAAVDTSLLSKEDLLALIPERLGDPPTPIIREFVQQIILVPTGGYREKYLTTWQKLQQENLRSHYCQIYRYPLQTDWRSTAVREASEQAQ